MSASAHLGGGPLPSEDEVRALVAAILADVAGSEVTASGAGEGSVGPETEPGGPDEIAIGADHGGYRLKVRIAMDLRERGLRVRDCGTDGTEPVDYPDIAHAVARLVADRSCRVGIVVDGAGIGSCMAANKVPGVRAATCWDVSSARNSREHNHANVLVLGGGLIGENLALEIVKTWLETPWGGDRHARRVAKIGALEERYLSSGVETGVAS
jgi:ribose 5-phosphate isomerase B